MSKNENKENWLNLVKKYETSGLSQKAFCEKNNLKLSSFRYWVSKASSNPSDKKDYKEEFEFASISISQEISSAIAVEASGISISVSGDYDEILLLRLIKTLKNI